MYKYVPKMSMCLSCFLIATYVAYFSSCYWRLEYFIFSKTNLTFSQKYNYIFSNLYFLKLFMSLSIIPLLAICYINISYDCVSHIFHLLKSFDESFLFPSQIIGIFCLCKMLKIFAIIFIVNYIYFVLRGVWTLAIKHFNEFYTLYYAPIFSLF